MPKQEEAVKPLKTGTASEVSYGSIEAFVHFKEKENRNMLELECDKKIKCIDF